MALSDRQVERYSRQIIVPGVGGIGQERLLAAKIAVVGKDEDLQAPLAYLVGTGVYTIFAPIDVARIDDLRDLNPDTHLATCESDRCDLALAIVGSGASLIAARRAIDSHPGQFTIVARLDSPPRIATFGASPCPRCADIDLLGDFGERGEQAEFIAMLATAEAIRIIATAEKARARLFEFDGYNSRSVAIRRRAGAGRCACESRLGRADG